MERRTQTGDIKKYLEEHKEGITSMEAIKMFGATRLASIIHHLRKHEGMDIRTETVLKKNRYGGRSPVAVYKLY